MRSWFNIENKSPDRGEMYIYGQITDERWVEEDVSPSWFKEQISKLKGLKFIDLFVNSGGGGVYAAMAIYNILKRQSAVINAYVDGIAASAAVIPLMAAKTVYMPKSGAMLMIHNAMSMAFGTAKDFRKEADLLDRVEENIISIYKEKKVKLSDEKIHEMMNEETWMNGEDAKKYGFVDELTESLVTSSIYNDTATINGIEIDTKKYKLFPTNKIQPVILGGIDTGKRNNSNLKYLTLKMEVQK